MIAKNFLISFVVLMTALPAFSRETHYIESKEPYTFMRERETIRYDWSKMLLVHKLKAQWEIKTQQLIELGEERNCFKKVCGQSTWYNPSNRLVLYDVRFYSKGYVHFEEASEAAVYTISGWVKDPYAPSDKFESLHRLSEIQPLRNCIELSGKAAKLVTVDSKSVRMKLSCDNGMKVLADDTVYQVQELRLATKADAVSACERVVTEMDAIDCRNMVP